MLVTDEAKAFQGCWEPFPRVVPMAPTGRADGFQDPWKPSPRVLGISPIPPKECLVRPIGDIGVPHNRYRNEGYTIFFLWIIWRIEEKRLPLRLLCTDCEDIS